MHYVAIKPVEIPAKINFSLVPIFGCKVPCVTVARKFFILIVRIRYDLIPPYPRHPLENDPPENAHNNVGGCARGMVTIGDTECIGCWGV